MMMYRIAQENSEEPPPPRRKRKRGGVHAEDMALVTPETAAVRSGWKVTEMGRVMRPVRIRPLHPLPTPLSTSVPKKKSKDKDTDTAGKPKSKKRRDPDARARRRTIDMTRWGSVHLSGVFLEDAGLDAGQISQDLDEVQEMVEAGSSDDSGSDDGAVAPPAVGVVPEMPAPVVKPTAAVAVPAPIPVSKPSIAVASQTAPKMVSDQPPQSDIVDLAKEKNQSLSLLKSLFEARGGEWGSRESVGSDVDEEELLKIGGEMALDEDDPDGIEFVPMDVDDVRTPQPAPPSPKIPDVAPRASPPPKTTKAPTQATKLKDLFVSREEDGKIIYNFPHIVFISH